MRPILIIFALLISFEGYSQAKNVNAKSVRIINSDSTHSELDGTEYINSAGQYRYKENGVWKYRLSTAAANAAFWKLSGTSTITNPTIVGNPRFNGNVGIGITPTFNLDISTSGAAVMRAVTTGNFEADLILGRIGTTPTEWAMYLPVGSTDLRLYNAGDKFTFSAAGHLGIGRTPASDRVLDVQHSLLQARFTSTGTAGPNIQLVRSGGTVQTWELYIPSATTDFRLWNGSADKFFFSSAGNLGIGVSPSHLLDAFSTTDAAIKVSTSGVAQSGIIISRTVNTPTSWEIYCPPGSTDLRLYNSSGGDKFTFATSGIGTATDWVATSDRRLKTNIRYVTNSQLPKISKISNLVANYDRKDTKKNETGFIAQELLKVAPEYVEVPKDTSGFYAVNYAKMVVPLYKGVDELSSEVSELRQEVAELKSIIKEFRRITYEASLK